MSPRQRSRRFLDRVRRLVRYRLIIPVFRSRHPPEYIARGVANGVFWGLSPSIGLQTIEIVGTWWVLRRVFGKDSSLLQALIWVWVNNPVTMVPMFYVFYVTGLWLMGTSGPIGGYDTFTALWDSTAALGWFDRIVAVMGKIGLAMAIGCLPYAPIGAVISYRWTITVVRHRQNRIRRGRMASGVVEDGAHGAREHGR